MAMMDSSTRDTSALDPKPRSPVLDEEKKSEINGHVSTIESKTEPQAEGKDKSADDAPPTEALGTDAPVTRAPATDAPATGAATIDSPVVDTPVPVEPKVAPQPEPASEPRDEPVVEKAAEPSPSPESKDTTEQPVVNGNGSSRDDSATSDSPAIQAAAKLDETKDEPKSLSSPTPEVREEPRPTVQDIQMEDRTEKPEEEPVKREEESVPQKSDDVQMTDMTDANETPEPTYEPAEPAKPAEPTIKSPSPVKEDPADTEMVDDAPPAAVAVIKPTSVEEPALPSQDTAGLPTSEVDLQPASLSQLNIETDAGTSPVQASVEVSMTEAPSVKIARERDDDMDADEPAPKRAKTEPKEEEAAVPAPDAVVESTEIVVEADAPGDVAPVVPAPDLNTLQKWNDPETDAKEITPHQRREMRKTIGRVRKTKGGSVFRDAVQKLWPALRDAYSAKIEKPMDLGELDRNLRDPTTGYTTFGGFRKDLSLIFDNTHAFNGPSHDVTVGAFAVIRATWEEMITIPAEEPVKPKAIPKPKPVRESRAVAIAEAAAKRQSAGPASSPVGDAPESKQRSQPPLEPAADRRASAVTDADRPKRTVRAPKPKDIDYTTKPSRKKLKPELQFCDEVLTDLTHIKHAALNQWFLDPVDAEGLKIPDYYAIIKKPMDLNKVARMLSGGEITSLKEFDKTVKMVFQNCYTFNGPPEQENPVSKTARQLELLYNSLMKAKDAWLSRYAKANAPAASASNASDDEDDEDDEDGDEAAVVDNSKEVEELRAKLDEESKKLNGMFASGTAMSMIEIQQGIVKMVQDALLKAAQNAHEPQAKQGKTSKKAAKGGKAKASGGRKSTGGASQPKKAGGSKKAAKKTLTAQDKDAVASAINDLDGGNLDRAIDIIKRDTGQNENNDGELELDIDQLSNEALLKLWELCKKALPHFGKDSAAPKSTHEINKGATAKQGPKTAAKPKKNKPMSAQEQEDRIARLKSLSNLYKPGQGPGEDGGSMQELMSPTADSSEDSDSEEE